MRKYENLVIKNYAQNSHIMIGCRWIYVILLKFVFKFEIQVHIHRKPVCFLGILNAPVQFSCFELVLGILIFNQINGFMRRRSTKRNFDILFTKNKQNVALNVQTFCMN